MRGITPLRLAVLAAVCLMFAARPSLWNFAPNDAYRQIRSFLLTAMLYFACSLPLFVLVVKAEVWTAGSRLRVRIGALGLAVVVGSLVFAAVNAAYRTFDGNFRAGEIQAWQSWHYLLAFFMRGFSTGALLSAILLFAVHERDVQRRAHQARLALVELERQAGESRLRLLQAQIEPHFLFNSLASVKRLYERERGSGRALLQDLGAYLRAASRGGKEREVALGGEIALARSFLAIFGVRMGSRLRVNIDVPPELESALVPPLMVGTLVENAIQHGIAPRESGGTLRLAARHRGESLELEIADDGVGFRTRTGVGVGLSNTRARLATLFGGAGDLDLVANPSGGVTAVLRVPYRIAPQPAPAP